MIAKRGEGRKHTNKRGMTDLVRYIANPEKAESIRVTNVEGVEPDNIALALLDMNATQALNSRAKTDSTYHLILSFPKGERPDAATLAAIEQHECEKIGLGDYQRISAIHTDTDHLHVHVAINCVHPETGNQKTPWYDELKLS